MLTEKATVIAIRHDTAVVETRRRSACGGCAVNTSCGTGVIARWRGDRPLRMEVGNTVGARVGEEVLLGVEEGVVAKGSLLVYALPLVTLLGGAFLGEWLRGGGSEFVTILCALLGFVLGWWLAARRLAGGKTRAVMRPVILARVAGPGGEEKRD
ncbi:MAG TPA: Fis family transcriptional regulator [Gammaproteobacteria bacterium]|nr:Fis family transcriptional regulator [Gammaproteobacteria bacterium]